MVALIELPTTHIALVGLVIVNALHNPLQWEYFLPEYKNQHYVPQFYMRYFADESRKRIGVFVLVSGKHIPQAPISGQACKNYFYGKDGDAERALGRMENEIFPILESLRRGNPPPKTGSQEHKQLLFYIGIQHSRTLSAETDHQERSEKAIKAYLRQKALLEGDERILKSLDLVRIKRTNAVSEVLGYATVGASLLTDLALLIVTNDTDLPFISSDAPVVMHNRLYEDTGETGVIGYANVGLQVIWPLGPKLLLMAYDNAAYRVENAVTDSVRVTDVNTVSLFNDLQWEQAHQVLILPQNVDVPAVREDAVRWEKRRFTNRVVFREETVKMADGRMKTRIGSGARASVVLLDLPFMQVILPKPKPFQQFEIPPFRNQRKVDLVDRVLDRLDQIG